MVEQQRDNIQNNNNNNNLRYLFRVPQKVYNIF